MVASIQSCHKVTVSPCNLLSAKQAPKLQGFNRDSETILKGFSNHKTEYSKIKFSQNTTNLLSIKVAFFFFFIISGNIFLIKALSINPLNAELNAICYLLALLGAHPILHVSRIRVKIDIGTTLHNLGS
jgi:hypothetical protein